VVDKPIQPRTGPFRLCVYHKRRGRDALRARGKGEPSPTVRCWCGLPSLSYPSIPLRFRREPPRLLGAGRAAHRPHQQGRASSCALSPPRVGVGGRPRILERGPPPPRIVAALRQSDGEEQNGIRACTASARRFLRAWAWGMCRPSRVPRRIPSNVGLRLRSREYVSPDYALSEGRNECRTTPPDLKGEACASSSCGARFNEEIVRGLAHLVRQAAVELDVEMPRALSFGTYTSKCKSPATHDRPLDEASKRRPKPRRSRASVLAEASGSSSAPLPHHLYVVAATPSSTQLLVAP